jgi:hypothetical protein
MPIYLADTRARFERRLDRLEAALSSLASQRTSLQLVEYIPRAEGLLSALWQIWCGFCRDTILQSAAGAYRANGTQVLSNYIGWPEAQVTWLSAQFARGLNPNSVKSLSTMRSEPTWGDLSKFNLIATKLIVSNASQLTSAVGSLTSLPDLQLCRNASAHFNCENLAEIKKRRSSYSETSSLLPASMAFWIDPISKDFAWELWLDDMRGAAVIATS